MIVRGFSGNYASGTSVTFYGPTEVRDFADIDFNDKINSLEVFKSGTFVMEGYWKRIVTLNDDISTSIT